MWLTCPVWGGTASPPSQWPRDGGDLRWAVTRADADG